MLHKMGFDCVCEKCKQPKYFDEITDTENGFCETCRDAWIAQQYAYWKPLYDGEKLAGLIPDKEYPNG